MPMIPVQLTSAGLPLTTNTKGEPVTIADVAVPYANPTQMEAFSFSRFALQLYPVVFTPGRLTTVTNTLDNTHFNTEAEAENFRLNVGGGPSDNETVEPAALTRPFRKVHEHHSLSREGTVVHDKVELTTEESVFPLAATLTLELYNPSGVLWLSAIQTTLLWLANEPDFVGAQVVNAYSDLNNPITLISGQQLRVRVKLTYAIPIVSSTGLGAIPSFINLYYSEQVAA